MHILTKLKKLSYKKKLITVVFILCCVLIFVFFYYRNSEFERHKFKVTFLDIGQGDAALIQFVNGEKMLVDCGPSKIILSALGRNMAFYDRRIDYLLSTHPDLDHYGGCIDVVKNYQIKKIITNGREKQYDPYWREWDRVARESGADVAVIDQPAVWSIASDTLQFVSPDPTLPLTVKEDDNNNYSIVFRLMHERTNFLFTGDMEEPLEKLLGEKYCGSTGPCTLQSDILKVGHHGSDGSSSELFLSFVRPKNAVISVGKNRYGHPTLRAMRHIERAGGRVRRTDIEGDIVVR